jgi:hypothetical protein
MVTGWVDFFKSKFSKNREFVSLDAKHYQENPKNYELKKFEPQSPEAIYSPGTPGLAAYSNFRTDTPEHFHKESQREREREYTSPTLSFSTPRPQSRGNAGVEWDPRSSHARGGLGFHPPGFEDKF